ncbi:DUF1549 and DUF1553 domain-containing protein [Urbifossiella limnaea]|uniref:DUF1553 domain-containing protein n=1 Tax=Urbifossiella limnaea TaxID=2528023 RepID=A0A517Y054_9BACT|nr:DUF1549 and DUF1553 domain-containing protein [Urbifossiella limnaea]QDU23078.1 hypothetical protein ETAA1_50690 [Urbifossiella limnaea]
MRLLLLPTLVLLLAAPARGDHWAFTRPARPPVPAGAANPVDAFVRARLSAAKLTPALRATPEQLLRRVTFDLTGLPPTPDEIDAFVRDPAPDAWAKVIDRLLASPHYGERWGRHWLDLARYADTNGYEFDEPRPDAWRYRDYVIRALNADVPYTRFVAEQLAGDVSNPTDPAARVATGFNLLGPDMTDASDQAQRRLNTLNDMTDTAALAFLGLTLTCARCHDHKFEPVPQADYFRFQAFFAAAAFRTDVPVGTPADDRAAAEAEARYRERTKDTVAALEAVEGPPRQKLFDAKLAKLSADAQAAHRTPAEQRTGGQLELVAETAAKVRVTDADVAKALTADEKVRADALRAKLKSFPRPPPRPVALGLTDRPGAPPKTFVLERGELGNKGAEVLAGFPTALGGGEGKGGRLGLAKWVASADNPLTARVIVNRLWQHHFGRGIVATASDFGTRGSAPTHPELLDWLACELADGGWTLKRTHRLMLLSETYQQSTAVSADAARIDPENRLFSRMNRLRLEGEAVRDAMLAASGRLNPKAGGPGVVLPELARAAGGSRPVPVTADAAEHTRRSVYLFARRNLRDPFLEAFDLPDSNNSCPKRERSTTAPQALALLNSAEAVAAAKALAARVTREADTDAARVARAYRLVLGRAPADPEQARAAAFLRESPLTELCRALFNLNEFMYLD